MCAGGGEGRSRGACGLEGKGGRCIRVRVTCYIRGLVHTFRSVLRSLCHYARNMSYNTRFNTLATLEDDPCEVSPYILTYG